MRLARIVGMGLLAAALGAAAAPPDRQAISPGGIAAPAGTVISCDQSPFGKAIPIVRDLEPMLQLYGSGGQFFDEYRPSTGAETPPLQRVFRANLTYALPLWKSVSADLNGDGRDEVVVAFSDGSSVFLAVYSRTAGPTALPIDTWTFTEPVVPDSIDLVAGDLDGSKDKHQEIGVSWMVAAGADGGKVRVVVLKGDASAHFVQADNSAAGKYLSAAGLAFPRLAVGDFLLAGRDQLVLGAYVPTSGALVLHLIELDDGGNPASVTTVLPSSGQAMRANSYPSTMGGGASFDIDSAAPIAMQSNGSGNGVIEGLDVDGGDVADTAAAEVVLHVMFPEPVSPVSHVLAQRVMHFVTTRDAQNVITGIALATYFPLGVDSSIMLERYTGNAGGPNAPPKFDATVADVDAIAGKEIVVARAGHDGTVGQLLGSMVWSAHRARVRAAPSFQYKNQALEDGLPLVAFVNNSLGKIKAYDWNFGDGVHSGAANPYHKFATPGNKSVSLTATDSDNVDYFILDVINVTGATDASPHGLPLPQASYAIEPVPVFTPGNADPDYLYQTYFSDKTSIRIAVGDTDHDGLPEVVVAVNNDGQMIDTHVFKRVQDGSFGRTTLEENVSATYMGFVLADFDGDSINGVLDAAGDCRRVQDKSMRSLTWMPPYFSILQAGANRSARYGKSSTNSSSVEEQSSSYSSSDVTGYLGIAAEFSIPIVAVKTAEVEFKGSAGYNYQVAKGATHGDENEYSVDQGWALDDTNQSIGEEGLLTTEQNTANCYSYDVRTASGIVPGSALRSCDVSRDPADKAELGPGAADWNVLATESLPIPSVPIEWVPAQRDWASLALFHKPKGGSSSGSIAFTDLSHGADKATDGLFDTAAESLTADKPYLEIDLGVPRDIYSVRVFPSADPKSQPTAFEPIDFKGAVQDLVGHNGGPGFRLYASLTPFSGNNPPTASNTTSFVPGGISTFVQDTGAEAVYRVWNVWTMDATTRQPLRTRYLRLQKPASGKIRIAEIQAFGDTHSEPQAFPQAVCDDRVGDGLFKALVYDAIDTHTTRVIQMRGDMIWTGAVNYVGSIPQDSGVPGCANDESDGAVDSASPDTVRQEPIWQATTIGAVGTADWALSQSHTQTQGTSSSIDSDTHVGAEFEAKVGPGVQVIVGASVEFSFGVSKENQSSLAVGTGFSVSGAISGFTDQTLVTDCEYSPRPFAFRQANYSNTGFRHDMYVTDYVVRQKNGDWQHGAVPTSCSVDDRIFADNFE